MSDNKNKIEEQSIKVILVGDSGVGKSSLILGTQGIPFNEGTQLSTVACSMVRLDITISDIKYQIDLWDTIGQENFHSLTKMFMKNSKVVIFVFDITNKASFDGLNYWIKTIEEELGTDIIKGICANKQDLIDDQKVDDETLENFAASKGLEINYASALTPNLFKQFLQKLVVKYLEKNKKIIPPKNETNIKVKIEKSKNHKVKKRKFC